MARSARISKFARVAAAPLILAASSAHAGTPPTVGPQVRIDFAAGNASANETSIAALHTNPLEVVGTWNDYRSNIRMGVSVSIDGGLTWVESIIRPPGPNQSSVEGDPMTCYDNRTGTLWVGAISFAGNGGVYVARKNAGATNFQPSVMARATGSADKGWMAAGPAPGDPNSTRVYIAYNQGVLRSSDMGATWQGPTSLGGGLGFLPRVAPNGDLYIVYWDTGSGVFIRRSTNGGVSFGPAIRVATRMDVWGVDGTRFPGSFRVPPLNYFAIDPNDGTLYVAWFDTTNIVGGSRNVDIYFSRSTNQGTTWTTPTIINGDSNPPGDQFFPWLEVDESGRIHMLFYDTRDQGLLDSSSFALINAYYSYSDDQGDTWDEIPLTPSAFNSETNSNGFIGDYLGLAVGGDRAYPCYLDTRLGNPNIYVNTVIGGPLCAADLDGDGTVGGADLAILLGLWGSAGGPADLDDSGTVTGADVAILLGAWGDCD